MEKAVKMRQGWEWPQAEDSSGPWELEEAGRTGRALRGQGLPHPDLRMELC
jgi:NTP pyrophosphatase (non-canonical NTP hydrolase)